MMTRSEGQLISAKLEHFLDVIYVLRQIGSLDAQDMARLACVSKAIRNCPAVFVTRKEIIVYTLEECGGSFEGSSDEGATCISSIPRSSCRLPAVTSARTSWLLRRCSSYVEQYKISLKTLEASSTTSASVV